MPKSLKRKVAEQQVKRPCPKCGAMSPVRQELNIFDEPLEQLGCPKCKSIYNTRDGGLHWTPVVEGNLEESSAS